MTTPAVIGLVAGLLAGGFAVGGVFFLRFWQRTRDGLFLAFATAFWLLALNQAAPVVLGIPREDRGGVYLLRLAAFLLIIFAVMRKNLLDRRSSRQAPPAETQEPPQAPGSSAP